MSRCADLDRIAPSRRPSAPVAGTQRWRDLFFLHYAVDPALVRPLVPSALELDTWDGELWIGVVPFVMRDIKSAWMPRVLALDFLETNLRTYVHYRGEPGVYFFSLEASSWLAVRVARAVWKLPYFHAEMSVTRDESTFRYASARREAPAASLDAELVRGEALSPSAPGTLEHFLLERYHLFSTKGSQLMKGTVHHVPYPAHAAHARRFTQTLTDAAGLRDVGALRATHFSPGVDVEVFGPWPV